MVKGDSSIASSSMVDRGIRSYLRTSYGVFEVYVWTLHAFLRAFKKFENVSRDTARKYLWPYYVIATILLYSTGSSALFLATFAPAVLNIFSTGLWGLALVYLDRTQL